MVRFSLTVLWLALGGCTPGQVDADSTPSVLLVTVDSLRADHVGAYGWEDALTPTLDRLAATGTLYLRAYSSVPMTTPSHATLFTGRYPPAHGVRDNGDFSLGEDQITLAERFSAAGYATIGVASAFSTRRQWGLDQGFQLYLEPSTPARSVSHTDSRPADEAVDEALRAMEEVSVHRPVFLWVHLYDPHFPYDPPAQWAAMFPGESYDGEIAFVDDEIGRLLTAWEARFGTERSVVVVTAPHGESLGEGGERTHGYLLNDGTLRVPLILRGPGVSPGQRSHDPVGLVDLAPTLLDLAGLSQHKGLQGDDLRDGGSDSIYSESLVGRYNLGLSPLYSVTDPNGRYTEGAWGAFYPAFGDRIVTTGVRMDPRGPNAIGLYTLRNWIGETYAPEVALDQQSLTMLSALGYVGGDPTAREGGVDPRDVIDVLPMTGQARRMIDIGMHVTARGLLDDLRSRMPHTFGIELMEAQLLYRQGRLAEADRAFQRLHNRNPTPTTSLLLAGVAVARARWTEASTWYDEAWKLDPTNAEAQAGRVRCAYVLGDRDLALSRFAEMAVFQPDDPRTSLIAAELALGDTNPQTALPYAEQAVRQMPWSSWAHAVQGRTLWDLGRSEEAVQALQEALRLDPYPAPLRTELVSVLLELGRDADALRVSAPLARMLADHPGAQEVYRLANEALTDHDWTSIRRDRAKSLDGRAPPRPQPAPPPAGGGGGAPAAPNAGG